MNDLYDDEVADELRAGFAGATYTRPAASLRRPSRAPMLIGATAAVAVVATAVAITSDGSRSPAVAWSPTPRQAGSEVAEQALAACSLDLPPVVGTEREPVVAHAAAGDVVTEGSVTVEGGGTVSPGSVPPVLPVLDLPTELPPLVALDVRGTGGLATFADDRWVVQCMLLPGEDGFEQGIVSMTSVDGTQGVVSVGADPSGGSTSSGSASVLGSTSGGEPGSGLLTVSSTTLPDGSTVSMALGSVTEGTAKVVAELPGLEPAEATLTGAYFSLWWAGATGGDATVRGYDAGGAELWSTVLPTAFVVRDAPPEGTAVG